MAVSASSDVPEVEDVIDLEPTMDVDVAGVRAIMGGGTTTAPVADSPAESGLSTTAGETVALRRHRLAATATLLAVAYATLGVWHFAYGAPHGPTAWTLIASRFLIAALVAGMLLGPLRLSSLSVRGLEVALFGGQMIIVLLAQYVVNLAMVRAGDTLGMMAFMKNGVIQVVILMLLYGTFIPNRPRTVALVVAAMALAPLFSMAILTEEPEVRHLAEILRQAEYTGSNALFLLMAAAMAVCGSVLLNGLRIELRRAQKYGHYRLIRKLGEGGMGEVYLAEHQLMKRPCALKLIKPEAGSDPIALARFEREVQSAARLSHPNTIEIYDYGHTGSGTFYYVMEYLRGMSLSELVRRDGPLPPGRIIYVFRQVCGGLGEAHRLGLVHRDLKPGNLFLAVRGGEADVAKVLDFGLVKLTRDPGAADISREMTVSGTPTYMAPEQAMGDRSLDARADIYALGAMMYYAMTGQPPFTGPTGFAIMMAQARDPVVPPSQLRPDVPDDLERVILRCLAKAPADRYPTVRALRDALSECGAADEWGPNRAEAWWAAEGLQVS